MRPHGRARVSVSSPSAHGVCDRCGFMFNLQDLKWQYDWRGATLINLRLLVCNDCYDQPQQQLRTIILPPDPIPVQNPRPERYDVEVPNFLTTESSNTLTTESSNPLITEINVTPTPTSSGFTDHG